MIHAAVVGAAGYAGIETVRWLLGHPGFDVACATSGADAGKLLSSVYPALTGATDLRFSEPDVSAIASCAQVAFLAVPHTAALAIAPALRDAGVTVIDLSADFRIKDSSVYETWYDAPHTAPDLLEQAVYGLPELDASQLPGAGLVACPGCYPTATALAAFPALESGIAVGSKIVADAKSGVSGAGRTPGATTHYVAATEALTAYKVGAHRHTPEIEQTLTRAAGRDIDVMFTPHLVPMSRGLLSTVYLDVEPHVTTEEVVALYQARFHEHPFVHVHDAGTMPNTSDVRGTNRAAIGLHVDARTDTLVAVCAIDNLGKGAAGQAVQCANIVFGYEPVAGLVHAIAPVV